MYNLDIIGRDCNGKRCIFLEVTSNYFVSQKLNRTEHDDIIIPKIPCTRN